MGSEIETVPALNLVSPELETRLNLLIEAAVTLQLETTEDLERAREIRKKFGSAKKAVEAACEEDVDRRRQAWKDGTAYRDHFLDKLKAADDVVASRAMKLQRKLQDEADKERRRLEEIARKEAEDQKVNAAADLEAAGHTEAAQSVLNDTTQPVLMTAAPEPPKVIPTRKYYRGKVVNHGALLQGIVAGSVNVPGLVDVNQSVLNKFGDLTKGGVQLPGVVWEVEERPINR